MSGSTHASTEAHPGKHLLPLCVPYPIFEGMTRGNDPTFRPAFESLAVRQVPTAHHIILSERDAVYRRSRVHAKRLIAFDKSKARRSIAYDTQDDEKGTSVPFFIFQQVENKPCQRKRAVSPRRKMGRLRSRISHLESASLALRFSPSHSQLPTRNTSQSSMLPTRRRTRRSMS